MNTKNVPKKQSDPVGTAQPARPPHEDMQAAYQIHTLAQMLYGQMATAHPWMPPTHPMHGFGPPGRFEAVRGFGPRGVEPLHGFDPLGGVPGAYRVPSWPVYWGTPFGWGI